MGLSRLPRPTPRLPAAEEVTTARVIAFANQKGGVAKTTTTLNLAVAFKEQGLRVLIVDLDPQGNLTMSQGLNPDLLERSLFDVLGNPARLGLDAAFPALFLALLVPQVRKRRALAAALTGGVLALVLVPVAAPGVPIIAASTACLLGWRR